MPRAAVARRRRPRRHPRQRRRPAAHARVGRGDGRGQGRRLRPRPAAERPRRLARRRRPGSASPSSTRRWRCARPGSTVPVLSWLHVPGQRLRRRRSRADVDLSVSAPWALDEVAAGGPRRSAARPASTSRSTPGWAAAARSATTGRRWSTRRAGCEAEGAVKVVGVWSHFAYADAPDHPTVGRSRSGSSRRVALAERAGCRLGGAAPGQLGRHPDHPGAHFDLVRPGLAVYGLSPVPDLGDPATFGLSPAMTLRAPTSRWSSACRPARGSPTGTPTSPSARRPSALVPLGYADGIPRNATNVGPVSLGGVRHTVSPAGSAWTSSSSTSARRSRCDAGDEVVLFGRGGATASRPPQDWADGDRHDLLRDRHPDRRPGAPDLRRRRAVEQPAPKDPHRRWASASSPPARPRRRAWPPTGWCAPAARPGRWTAPTPTTSWPTRSCVVARRRRRAAARRGRRAPAADAPRAGRRCPRSSSRHGYALSLGSWDFQRRALTAGRLPRRGLGPARPRPLGHRPQESATRSTSSAATWPASSPRRRPRGRSCWSGTRWAA